MKLKNSRHERFCQEYIIDLNQTKAYERTYGKAKGSRVSASKLLAKANVSERIAELKAIRSERTVITQDMVLRELKILAESDIKDYLEIVEEYPVSPAGTLKVDGRLKMKMFKEMKGDVTKAIKSISEHITKDGIQLKFKLHSKEKPLELLGKHLDMFTEKFDVSDELKKILVERIFTDKRPKE